jgi:hypothetical protein
MSPRNNCGPRLTKILLVNDQMNRNIGQVAPVVRIARIRGRGGPNREWKRMEKWYTLNSK